MNSKHLIILSLLLISSTSSCSNTTSDSIYGHTFELNELFPFINDVKETDIDYALYEHNLGSINPRLDVFNEFRISTDEDKSELISFLKDTKVTLVKDPYWCGGFSTYLDITLKSGETYHFSEYIKGFYYDHLYFVYDDDFSFPPLSEFYGYQFLYHACYDIELFENNETVDYDVSFLREMIFNECEAIEQEEKYTPYKFSNSLGEIVFLNNKVFKINCDSGAKFYNIVNDYEFKIE